MVKKIIAAADIHIRNFRRNDEYQEKLQEFIDLCRDINSKYKEGEVRIVIAGDLLHNKTDISPEAYLLCSWFLGELGKITKTIIIAGNHDISMNETRLDPLSSIFTMSNFDNVFYLDSELNYESGCLVDDNIVWCLYSVFDNFNKPTIDEYRVQEPDCTFVGLYHGVINGAKTDVGYQFDSGLSSSYFDGVDFAIVGHIHKRQTIKNDGVPLVYCGSLLQQDFGENLTKHGFLVWDVETCGFEEIDIDSKPYGFYTFTIKDESDIDKDKEELINF